MPPGLARRCVNYRYWGKRSPSLMIHLPSAIATILALLTGSRREAYETGKRNAQREDTAAALPPASALDELDDKRQSVKKRRSDEPYCSSKVSRGKGEELQRDSKEAGNTIEQTAAQFEEQLNVLATQYQSVAARFLEVDQSLMTLQNQYAQATNPQIGKSPQMAAGILQLHNAIATLKKEQELCRRQMESILKPAKVLLKNYYLFLARSHLSQQEIARRSKNLKDWEKRIAWREETVAKLPDKQTKREGQVDDFQRTLEMHFPLDFEVEKVRILNSFSATADRSITNPPAR